MTSEAPTHPSRDDDGGDMDRMAAALVEEMRRQKVPARMMVLAEALQAALEARRTRKALPDLDAPHPDETP